MNDLLTFSAAQAAGVVLLIQQILKLNIIPISIANKYPVPTNIVLSVIATVIIVPLDWAWGNAGTLALQVGTVAVTAAIAYNQLLAKWDTLKNAEGDGKK